MEWKAINSYFAKGISRLVEHQIESFEDFIRVKIPLIVASTPPIVVWNDQDPITKKYRYEFRLSCENITYAKPQLTEATGRVKPMFPKEARIRKYTYASQMFCDVRFVARSYSGPQLDIVDESVRIFQGVSLGRIPIMLGSSLCILNDYPLQPEELGEDSHDPRGYFIVHGTERTILCQEKVADNRDLVFAVKKTSAKHSYSIEFKSLHEGMTTPPKKLEFRVSTKFNGLGYPIVACVPRFQDDIPIMVFFRALGVKTDEEIWKLVERDGLEASFKDCAELQVYTQDDAILYLTHHLRYTHTHEDKCAYVRTLLDSELLPHVRLAGEICPTGWDTARKVVQMASMLRRILPLDKIDDRDAYPNKRIVSPGSLLTHFFRQLFQKVCKDIRSKFVQEVNNDSWKRGSPRPTDAINVNNLFKILKVATLEGKLKQAIATGNFNLQGIGIPVSTISNATKVGVSQVLNRLSYQATISHLRRIQTPVDKSGKLLAPRKLHTTSYGFMCPVETPEGHSVGIVKAFAMMTSTTQHMPTGSVLTLLKESPLVWVDVVRVYEGTPIYVNGTIVAYTSNPPALYKILKDAKYSFRIHPHTGIVWDISNNMIRVETDGGRVVRPLFRVHHGALLPPPTSSTWNDWVRTCIEFVDAAESETIRVAMFPRDIQNYHTHCEIHPIMTLGYMASSIPFSDHNQSPRNAYSSAMSKQNVGIFARNFNHRIDKASHILCNPERPLVETRIMKTLHADEMPFGDNVIVAILTYGGDNQEDSVILNRSAVQRGLFKSLYYTMYTDEEHRNVNSGKEEKFMKARKETTRGFKTSSYNGISETGIPILNSTLRENDVVIGKVVSLKQDPNGYAYRDASTLHRNSEPCRVDWVGQDKNSDGYPFVKVRVVSERTPEVGDKFSSRHAQKGTCGIMMDEKDMPFTASGMRPDLIMNPHAIPSRMTIAHIKETLMGKVCVQRGTIGDGTPYSNMSIEELKQQMVDLGMHPFGNEIMYSGHTGEMMQAEIFVGPTFYMRLKHMVADKLHSRAKGPIVSLTRQPCEGRSRDGGLRVGEMERDCMLSHGIAAFTKERFMDVSDAFSTDFCAKCGVLDCKEHTTLTKTIPYAVKLWAQELQAMHIQPRLIFG